jgi:hypothetical protein
LIQRRTGIKPVQYAVVDGLAIFEGDIVLGTVEEVEAKTQELRDVASGAVALGVAITGDQFRWKNCKIPFTIDPALPNKNRVTDAIAHWQSKTNYTFVERTAANAAQFPDFVTYRSGGGCSSQVGRRGGQQFVTLGDGCTTGNAIHETGHVVGLWHEQSREDRDHFVTIHFDKIQAGFEHNFDQHINDGDDIGAYDYGSIMHYPRDAFSKDGSDTITPTNPANAQIGQRVALSAGDIAAANSLCTPVKKAIFDTKKEVIKDLVLDTKKESIFDTKKEVVLDTKKELVLDTIKESALDTIKEAALDKQFDPLGPDPGRITQPIKIGGVGTPFAVATPRQAPGAGDAGDAGDVADAAMQLDQQLQQIADALAQIDAQRAALQAQYDEISRLLTQAVQQHDEGQG